MFELELVVKPKSLGLAWLVSQVKLELNIKLKFELQSSFWVWDVKKLHYQILKSLKLKKKKEKKIVYSFYRASSPTYD